ncbi:MAG: hypothetical protein V4691_00105 [Pseudomonadota bacterium]
MTTTRQKIENFRETRRIYMMECRADYNYQPRAKARAIGSSHRAGFVSALFGCVFMIAIYSTFDLRPMLDMVHMLTTTIVR